MLTRISPLQEDDKDGFTELENMVHNIDPDIALKSSKGSDIGSSLEAFKQFYYDTFGIPGTSEFEQKLKEINQKTHDGGF